MIEVTVYKTMRHEYAGFDMSGHAGYDDIGKDIVCAAVSVLVINTLNSIERFTDDKTSCVSDENSGTVEFRFKDHPSHDAALLLDSMILGLEDMKTVKIMNHTLTLFSRRCKYHDENESSVFCS